MNGLGHSRWDASWDTGTGSQPYAAEATSLAEAWIHREEDQQKWIVYESPIWSEKQTAGADGKEVVKSEAYGLRMSEGHSQKGPMTFEERASHGRRRKRLLWACVVIIVILLGICLGAGLGIGLKSNHQNTGLSSDGSKSFSTRGAYLGTGIKTNFDGKKGFMTVFYQHYNGDIRQVEIGWPSLSRIHSANEIVAVNAKNGTPIAATSILPPDLVQQHIFYIGKDGTLKQRILDNSTNVWVDGPLNAQNITVFDSDDIGLVSGYYGGPIETYDTQNPTSRDGIRLWVATSETTFDQMAWRYGLPSWILEQNWFGMNGHASPATNGLQPGHTTYVLFVNQDNKVDFYWRDTTENVASTSAHPLNEWESVSLDFPVVDPSIGLSWHELLYAEPSNTGDMSGWNISFAAENSTIVHNLLPAFNGDCISESSLSVFTSPVEPSGGKIDDVFLYCQTEGDDITLYSAKPSGDSWSKAVLPIPDD